MAPSPTVLLAYYSRTGTTAAVAQSVVGHLDEPTVERLQPRRQRGYLNWLLRSFVPRSTVAIEPIEHDPRAFDAVVLGTPKWTFSCPPVTRYLDSVRFDGTPVGLFLTFGGFDQDRYARRLEERIRSQGATAVEALLIKRDRLEPGDRAATGLERDVARFVASVLERAEDPGRPSEDVGEVG